MTIFFNKQKILEFEINSNALAKIVCVLQNWHKLSHPGMQFTLYKKGQLLLDVAVGSDPFTSNKIEGETLFCVLSVTKALASMVMLLLHDKGIFEWSDRISEYWPEFGKRGKTQATIEHLMSHRLGLPYLTAPQRYWNDHGFMNRLVEDSSPLWKPGTKYGYHGGIFGTIINEIVYRWTGKSVGDILRKEICLPSEHPDCYIGMPYSKIPRLAKLVFEERDLSDWENKTLVGAPSGEDWEYNSPDIVTGCHPSGGGVATSRDLAGVFTILASEGFLDGHKFWSRKTQRDATIPRNLADSELPMAPGPSGACWGLGFIVPPSRRFYGSSPPGNLTVGHIGWSGSIAYADPELQISVAFVTNGIKRSRRDLCYEVLGNLVKQACAKPSNLASSW